MISKRVKVAAVTAVAALSIGGVVTGAALAMTAAPVPASPAGPVAPKGGADPDTYHDI